MSWYRNMFYAAALSTAALMGCGSAPDRVECIDTLEDTRDFLRACWQPQLLEKAYTDFHCNHGTEEGLSSEIDRLHSLKAEGADAYCHDKKNALNGLGLEAETQDACTGSSIDADLSDAARLDALLR